MTQQQPIAMDSIIHQLSSLAQALPETYNQEVLEFNQLMDELDSKNAIISQLTESLENAQKTAEKDRDLMEKQNQVIEKAVEVKKKDDNIIIGLRAQLKELQSINPKRLMKVNKELQKKNAELKESNEVFKKQRNEYATERNQYAKSLKAHTDNVIHTDEHGNQLRFIPETVVSQTNEFDGVPDTPIYEYVCKARGIIRQGVLRDDGNIVWASAQNSTPTETMTAIAKQHVIAHCKRNKINLKRQLKQAA
ncbi:hypothetical protein JQC92_02535 [Shewanella sp. 202IG2-18]|uniref:hypothetical protein n=1 Tax=Parashewanella hymeniacidonis TaxID=2807618 RepID=UPI001961117C|nr:hypothetical protein [Parashewanella hymeniacidonis]MBM7070919.1 hypothetical protein [Parashewanella hymeniacidonis]